VPRPANTIDYARYATLAFLERIDPAIRHRPIAPAEAAPLSEPDAAHNQHPQRRWCESSGALCIASRYQLEGQLPIGVRLANKLTEGKKISEYMDFQGEVRLLRGAEADQDLARLTVLASPVAAVLEQSIFHVNQVMQFARFLAVFQPLPGDQARTVATLYMALAVETDVLEMKKEYQNYPVLRNLVPAQVLMGKSSFNTGSSISAGLPEYARNRVKAIAAILNGA
jgi:hypothetical protein